MRHLKKPEGRGRGVFPALVLFTALASRWCCAADLPVSEVLKKTSETYRNFGKVVLLDFWATWCGPCREELTSIEKLNKELKGKGLVILGINDEDTGTAKSFLKKNEYTLETLMDSKREVHRMYGVRAIPTVVVISATGVVAANFVGTRSEEQLRAALKTAGLESQGQGTAP